MNKSINDYYALFIKMKAVLGAICFSTAFLCYKAANIRPAIIGGYVMATNRSRRLRKKLCVDEFQELGFELQLNYPEEITDTVIEAFFADLVVDAIEGKGMALIGGEEFAVVCSGKRGSVTEAQRAEVEAWLKGRKELSSFEISPLLDVWYPDNPVNPA